MIDFLYTAVQTEPGLPPLPKKTARTRTRLQPPVTCAFTGNLITEGYPLKTVVTSSTSEVSDTFRYSSEYVSVETAELFRAQRLLRGNLLFLENQLLRPMISLESATNQNRPCWRNLIYELPIGTPTLAIFTDESKRRLWHQTHVSDFGEQWHPFLNGHPVKTKTFKAPPLCRSLQVNVLHLRPLLRTVETAQQLGFSKLGIFEGLYSESNIAETVGYPETKSIETELSQWRDRDEFRLALLIAQKTS